MNSIPFKSKSHHRIFDATQFGKRCKKTGKYNENEQEIAQNKKRKLAQTKISLEEEEGTEEEKKAIADFIILNAGVTDVVQLQMELLMDQAPIRVRQP